MYLAVIVIGLLVLAALISSVYISSRVINNGYTLLDVNTEEFKTVATIPGKTHDEDISVVVYRSRIQKPGWELTQELHNEMMKRYDGYSARDIKIGLEPGYSAFRIYEKQRDWTISALTEWPTSIFHAIILPIDVFVRSMYFTTWTMIDFVSRDHCIAAAIVTKKESDIFNHLDVSLIETHVSRDSSTSGLYMRLTSV